MNFTHHLGEEINENNFLTFLASMKETSTQMIFCGSEVSVR